MARTSGKDLIRLARLAREIEHKRVLSLKIQERLTSLQRAGAVVTGESDLLADVQDLLDNSLKTLQAIEQANADDDSTDHLSSLEHMLSDVQWDVAEIILPELDAKDKEQQRQILRYREQIIEWQAHIDGLLALLAEARNVRAPVVREDREVRRLQAIVEQADRGLRDQQFDILLPALETLHNEQARPAQLVEAIRAKSQAAAAFVRQADLLLLQSPLANRRFQYTVLMRTPSEPGSHGVNIQDSRTLVEHDHDRLQKAVQDVTSHINAGLARQFTARSAPPAEPVAATSVAAAPVAGRRPELTEGGRRAPQRRDAEREMESGAPAVLRNVNDLAQDIGDLMYRVLVPDQMQRYLRDTQCAMTITTNDLEVPWELMWSEGAAEPFLCLDRPVARLPMGRAFPRQEPRPPRPDARIRFLLVYADPAGNLNEAGKEVDQIAQSLHSDWKDIEVTTLRAEQANGEQLNKVLRSGEYDVIHYAGHASFDDTDADLSGLLLHDNEVFFAQKIRSLLEGRPLVFLNACESGRTANERQPQTVGRYLQKPAEGLASAFIYGGAIGCIGSLWPVYDDAAAAFATHFYNKVLEGYMIGEAMRQTRHFVKGRYPDQITWATFVLYGDPTFRLGS